MMSPVSSQLSLELEIAYKMEAEEPTRFSITETLPYFSEKTPRNSTSDFDTPSESSGSTSFSNLNDSNRITLASLIGLPMDSFRHLGESFRFNSRGDRHFDRGSNRPIEGPDAHHSRSCSVFFEIFHFLQRIRTGFVKYSTQIGRNLNLTSFTITAVSEEEDKTPTASHGVLSSKTPCPLNNAIWEATSTNPILCATQI
uniref:Uncharacterized protein n=1 Tax=Physcomitrium patens TaxID=3218 RepID=A0A2K1J1J9_PHYPA|nr:hypothetical protein PHYPA_023302 [Physcomitrium patens]